MKIHNLINLFTTFNDRKEIDRMVIVRGYRNQHKVQMYDIRDNLVLEADLGFVKNVAELEVTASDHNLGYEVGLRKSFMLTNFDEPYIAEYWARRKKPKAKASKKGTGTLGKMTKEVIAEQVKAGKALLATLTKGGAK
jgi:hypothetical protein